MMPTNGTVICQCGRFMEVAEIGVCVEELMEDGAPYRLWSADRFRCPECGTEVVTKFGNEPIAEHYQPGYASRRADTVYPGRCRTAAQQQDAGQRRAIEEDR